MPDRSDTTVMLVSRRGLLAKVAGAAAAIAATAGLIPPVQAAVVPSVLLGSANVATAATLVTTTTGSALAGVGAVHGVAGTATGTLVTNIGVTGKAGSTANYGVLSNGKAGVTGPVEIGVVTITGYAGPAAGKAFLYTKTNLKVTELRIKFPSGKDLLVTSG